MTRLQALKVRAGLQLIAAAGRCPKVSPADGLLEDATTVYALPFWCVRNYKSDECVMVQKSKHGEIRRMAGAAVGDADSENVNVVVDENVRESMDVYEIFE
ncbi:hypothetical protein FQA39_LY09176 [Lamprigera yunnana]|nr:hypothetical protein FQA39_LY09176 [Lamprigera yunnana]